jgi:MYXO-CTERM domain-containing protein
MGSITVASNNKTSATFVGSDGTNPDFHLASGSPLINAGTSTSAPATDIGFDPMCITKGKPTDIAVPSWSAYSVNYTYIKSIGGVAKCWNPGKRPSGSGIDIGAYESGATAVGTATCTPLDGSSGTGGSGAGGSSSSGAGGSSGTGGKGGTGATGQGGSTGAGGSGPTGGTAGTSSGGAGGPSGSGAGGQSSGGATGASGGSAGAGGTSVASGGTVGSSSGGSSGSGGVTGLGGAPGSGGAPGNGGSGTTTGSGGSADQTSGTSTPGCSCGVAGSTRGSAFLALLLGIAALRLRRRRSEREMKLRHEAGGDERSHRDRRANSDRIDETATPA